MYGEVTTSVSLYVLCMCVVYAFAAVLITPVAVVVSRFRASAAAAFLHFVFTSFLWSLLVSLFLLISLIRFASEYGLADGNQLM